MISSLATPGDGGAEEAARGVAAGLQRAEADGLEARPDLGHVLDLDPVVLDVLPVGDVGGVAAEVGGDAAEGPQLRRAEQGAVAAHAHHEVPVVQLVRLERGGLAAVEAGGALGVEAHPAEASAQVGRVDGVEAALGVDVADPGLDVERVVVLLGLLVRVQRLAVAEGPLALTALGAGGAGCVGVLAWSVMETESLASDARLVSPVGDLVVGSAVRTERPGRMVGGRGVRPSRGRTTVRRANTSCCGCARGPRGVEPRGTGFGSGDHAKKSQGTDTLTTSRNLVW